MIGAVKTITINFVAGLLMFSAISTIGGFMARLGTYGGFPLTQVMRELSLIPGPKMIGMLLTQASDRRSYSDEVINGIGYSARYRGATLDVRVNACIIDAEKLTNGNTSGVCDSSGEGGAQTIAAQINVGDTKRDVVTWILPSYCLWGITIKDGTSSAIYQVSDGRRKQRSLLHGFGLLYLQLQVSYVQRLRDDDYWRRRWQQLEEHLCW
jgi:hypothetical protein